MKTLTLLFALTACLVACGPVQHPSAWQHAGSGSCYDVDVTLRATEPATCPHRDHAEPLEVARNEDAVAYRCFCWR